jgi:hypothetical protein
MLAYDEMVQSFNALLECKTLSEFERLQERTLADGVRYAVFGPEYRGTRVIHDSTILMRKKEALQECLKEMCHDGVNIFRVMVLTEDDDEVRQFPVVFKNGNVYELRYCLQSNVNYEIKLSLLSRGDQNVGAYYTAHEKEEVFEGEYIIQQTFGGQKLSILQFTEPDEVDMYRLISGANNMTI